MDNQVIRKGWDTGDWSGMPPVTIHPYDPAWVDRYEVARQEIEQALVGLDASIEHVGSTAVPGLGARNSIDILIGMDHPEDMAACIERLQNIGFKYHFTEPDHTHLSRYGYKLHLGSKGGEGWTELLLFRDHLRQHPDALDAYHRLKQDLAQTFGQNGQRYVDGKADFVRSVVRQAEREANRKATAQATDNDELPGPQLTHLR
jgi:GrpB-like predicted nucleotidyltransferase (UPF0157 family)